MVHYDLSPKYVNGVHVMEDANDIVVITVAAQGNPWATVSCTMLMSNDCMEAEARSVAAESSEGVPSGNNLAAMTEGEMDATPTSK